MQVSLQQWNCKPIIDLYICILMLHLKVQVSVLVYLGSLSHSDKAYLVPVLTLSQSVASGGATFRNTEGFMDPALGSGSLGDTRVTLKV